MTLSLPNGFGLFMKVSRSMLLIRSYMLLLICLVGLAVVSNAKETSSLCASSSSAAASSCRGGVDAATAVAATPNAILKDIQDSLKQNNKDDENEYSIGNLGYHSQVKQAAEDFSTSENNNSGLLAWKFLRGLASSEQFQKEYWHKQPLLIRARDTGGWVSGAFTVERDLRLVDGSYISGHMTANVLRNGSKTDTWAFTSLKPNPTQKTTWHQVEKALEGGTIYFNTAGSLWLRLGGLCRLTNAAFGIPSNVNVYVTPPGTKVSVPPHTDRQDVLVFQTAGAKRWRVFAPPPRSKGTDPLNRGKNSDVLTFDEMGPPLIDTVVRKGDVLYVPTGFPHTTDTCTAVDVKEDDDVFDETSVHMTMGLDSNVWALTLAHMRWSVLQRCGLDFNLQITDDDAYWQAMETIPIGFLGGKQWTQCLTSLREGNGLDKDFRQYVIDETKRILKRLEPNRWKTSDNEEGREEVLPTDEQIGEVVDYMVQGHLLPLMEVQERMFSNVDPRSEESLIKSYQCIQQQNSIMERFGQFCKNEAMQQLFEKKRLEGEAKAKYL